MTLNHQTTPVKEKKMEDLIKKVFLIILLFNFFFFWPKIEINDDVFHLAVNGQNLTFLIHSNNLHQN